jgi:hypothetical protein
VVHYLNIENLPLLGVLDCSVNNIFLFFIFEKCSVYFVGYFLRKRQLTRQAPHFQFFSGRAAQWRKASSHRKPRIAVGEERDAKRKGKCEVRRLSRAGELFVFQLESSTENALKSGDSKEYLI